jgi:hypothetical protein
MTYFVSNCPFVGIDLDKNILEPNHILVLKQAQRKIKLSLYPQLNRTVQGKRKPSQESKAEPRSQSAHELQRDCSTKYHDN